MASDVRPERSKAHRLKRLRHEGLKPPVQAGEGPSPDAVLDCGWGRTAGFWAAKAAGLLTMVVPFVRMTMHD